MPNINPSNTAEGCLVLAFVNNPMKLLPVLSDKVQDRYHRWLISPNDIAHATIPLVTLQHQATSLLVRIS
jgi:hypothetical protein